MAPADRTKFFQTRVSEDELAMLNALCEARGVSASDVVRGLVREQFVEQFGEGARPVVVEETIFVATEPDLSTWRIVRASDGRYVGSFKASKLRGYYCDQHGVTGKMMMNIGKALGLDVHLGAR